MWSRSFWWCVEILLDQCELGHGFIHSMYNVHIVRTQPFLFASIRGMPFCFSQNIHTLINLCGGQIDKLFIVHWHWIKRFNRHSTQLSIQFNFFFNFFIYELYFTRAHLKIIFDWTSNLGSRCVWVLMVLQNRTQQIITAASSSQLREVNDDDDDDRDDNNNDRQHQNDEKPIIFLLVYGVCLSVCVYGKHKQKKLTV